MNTHIDVTNTHDSAENPRIGSFRDECMLFGDFNRPVFLEEIERFIWSASKEELASLRAHIARRAKSLMAHRAGRGRPRGVSDEKWLAKAKIVAWRRHVDEWSWPEIAKSEGLKPTKENIRTLTRRRNRYAGVVWEALTEVLGTYNPSPDRIEQTLGHPRVQQWLWSKASVPFRWLPHECKKLVQALAPLGPRASVENFTSQINYLTRKTVKKAPGPGVNKPL